MWLPVDATPGRVHLVDHRSAHDDYIGRAGSEHSAVAGPAGAEVTADNAGQVPRDESERPCSVGRLFSLLVISVRTTLYTLDPETMQLGLTHVDAPTALTSSFYEVTLILTPSSAAAWASFTAAHLHDHVAFIRDDLVLEAPIIEEQVASGRIALTTQTSQLAVQLAQLAGRPA